MNPKTRTTCSTPGIYILLNIMNIGNYILVYVCISAVSYDILVWLRNTSGKPECVLSFNMGWRILVFYPEQEAHNLCCQIQADDYLSTCTFTTGQSVTGTCACANRSFLYKAKKGVMLEYIIFKWWLRPSAFLNRTNIIHMTTCAWRWLGI